MIDAVPLSNELLATMRNAAKTALDLREPFITPRAILLALLDDADVGPPLAAVVSRQKVLDAQVEENFGVVRTIEESIQGEPPPMTRYDTLAFKTPDGRSSVWLSRHACDVFIEGARRVEDGYDPKHLALGLAAGAIVAPGILSSIRVEPGALVDAVYKL